jgi:D-arabinose 1-dehydrogenase-like Zn-dependent alcohol dehydrogenase
MVAPIVLYEGVAASVNKWSQERIKIAAAMKCATPVNRLPAPDPASDEVVIRVAACGICRTDLHVIAGELPLRISPIISGHQVVGIVAGRGREASL